MEVVDSMEDEDTRFIVHVKRPGVVALQSKNHRDNWIGIINGDITGAVSLMGLFSLSLLPLSLSFLM